MPPSNIRKRQKQRARRGRAYLLGTTVFVIVIAVGWYVYASTQAANLTVPTAYATLNTPQGAITVELYGNAAPKTVTNFVNLAQSGFYDNLTWHRIVKGFVIQTGDPNTKDGMGDRSIWGTGGSSQTVPLEIERSLHNYAGYLGMARSDLPNSGSSQFYINLGDNTNLDGQYTVFGKVIRGMDAAYKIANVQTYPKGSPYQDQPVDPVFLTSVAISNTLPA